MMNNRHEWEAWIGQRVAQCYTEGNMTTIILEDGRGITFPMPSLSFYHFGPKSDPTGIFKTIAAQNGVEPFVYPEAGGR